MQKSNPGLKILFSLAAICGAAYLLYLIDDGLGLSWPANTVRNWQEYGFFALHGKLVYNMGGYDVLNHPQVYQGMSPLFLYPVILVVNLFSWTGLGTMAFQILLLVVMLWAGWSLMGRDNFALLVAALAVLCPGYLRWTNLIDPGSLSVLPVLPYAVIALWILKQPKLTLPLAVALVILTLGFLSLNWTAAWVCAPCFFFFWGVPGINRRTLALIFIVMAIGIPAVTGFSFMTKAQEGEQGAPTTAVSHRSNDILGGHLWGNVGYGEGMTSAKALIRVAFINGVGLFPLWLAWLWALWGRIRSGAKISWVAFAPLAFAVADFVIMRNYFGHHPWMAGPVLVVGAVFSIALLRAPSEERRDDLLKKISFKWVGALGVMGFVYGLAVLVMFRANETNLLSLADLVRHHTARSDILVIAKSDTVTAAQAERLNEVLDRHIIIVDDVKEPAEDKDHWIVLSPARLDDSFTLVAQSAAHSPSAFSGIIDWFNHKVSKRNPGDRLDVADSYSLYEGKPAH